MLVSHRHKFIYTKTKKTAGTSVESYFERYCMAEGEWSLSHGRQLYVSESGIIGQRGGGNAALHPWWNHMPAQQIRKQLGEVIWADYYKFCVVRNPFEKTISMFYFRKKNGAVIALEGEPESAQFERWLLTDVIEPDRDIYCIDGAICMDYVIRYERLAADLEKVCVHLDLPWNPEMLPAFKSGLRPATSRVENLYTDRARKFVSHLYAFELETFGYRFGE